MWESDPGRKLPSVTVTRFPSDVGVSLVVGPPGFCGAFLLSTRPPGAPARTRP